MKKCEMKICGMTCSACAAHVEDAVAKIKGVESVRVSLLSDKAQIVYDERQTGIEDFRNAVKKAGYCPEPDSSDSRNGTHNSDSTNKTERLRVVFSFLFLIPLFLTEMGPMAACYFTPESPVAAFSGTLPSALIQLLLLLPILVLNRSYFSAGFKTLFKGKPIMDSLIAVGAGAAVIYSLFSLFQIGFASETKSLSETGHNTHFYFESAGMILTLVSLGKYLESRARRKTSSVIEKLIDLTPRTVTVIRSGREETVSVDMIKKGDLFLMKAGDTAAADGIVTDGCSSVDESALTGESIPVEKNPGDLIMAGSVNKWGLLTIRATHVGRENTLARIISLVEEASSSKAPIARLADKISRIFVPLVMATAFLSFAATLATGLGFETALSRAIATLVISCPCALGLATPTAVTVGIGRGAEMGILIRNGEALEKAGRIDCLLLDKTGTVTKGKPSVTAVLPATGITAEELIAKASSLESGSSHPLAEAVVSYAESLGIMFSRTGNSQTTAGKGIRSSADGKEILGGNAAFLKENGIVIPEEAYPSAGTATPLFFAENGHFLGTILTDDEPTPDSAHAVAALKAMRITPVMLTGDRPETAAAVAEAVGISSFKAGLLPEDKESEVRHLLNEGLRVGMVGDGINDSPALARADIGIAPAGGSDIAVETAEIILMNNRLSDAVTALQLSRKVMINIRENLFWALFYNCLGIPAASGLLDALFGIPLPPGFAAAAMSLSSICVVGNALRLKRFRPRFSEKEKNTESKGDSLVKIIELKIDGMMCEHCRSHVESALNALAGVEASVDLKTASAECRISGKADSRVLEKAVAGAGYKVVSVSEKQNPDL